MHGTVGRVGVASDSIADRAVTVGDQREITTYIYITCCPLHLDDGAVRGAAGGVCAAALQFMAGDISRGCLSCGNHAHGLRREVNVTNAKRAPDTGSNTARRVLAQRIIAESFHLGCGEAAADTFVGQARDKRALCASHGGGWREATPVSQAQIEDARRMAKRSQAEIQRDAAVQRLRHRLGQLATSERGRAMEKLMQAAGPYRDVWFRGAFGVLMTPEQLSRMQPPVPFTGATALPSGLSAAFGRLAVDVAVPKEALAEADGSFPGVLARMLEQLEGRAQSAEAAAAFPPPRSPHMSPGSTERRARQRPAGEGWEGARKKRGRGRGRGGGAD